MSISEDFKKLSAPFPAGQISWRIGSTSGDKKKGLALAYIDARDVMARLDDVCGPQGWQCRYPHANGKTVCEIGIKVSDEWIWKADGAGDSDVEAEKGALSDAFKRAAVRWGIGRYLYELPSPWVEIESAGRSFKIAAGEYSKLERMLNGGSSPNTSGAPSKAATFVQEAKAKILAFDSIVEMGTWWNSAEQKRARAAAGITQSDLDDLKAEVAGRKSILEQGKQAA